MAMKTATNKRGTTEFDRAMGARIKMYREAKNMSQETLAKTMGVTFQQVQKYEHGTNRVAAERLLQAAQTLEVTVTDLFGNQLEEGGNPANDLMTRMMLAPYGVKLALAYICLPKPLQIAIAEMTERLTQHAQQSPK